MIIILVIHFTTKIHDHYIGNGISSIWWSMWPIRDHYHIFNLTKKSLFSAFIGPKTFFFGIVFCVKLWTFDYTYVRLWTFLSFLFVCSQHFWTFYTDSVCFGTFKTKDLPCSFVCVERWLVLRVPACPSSPTTHYPTLSLYNMAAAVRSSRQQVAVGAQAAPGEFDRGWGCLKVFASLPLHPFSLHLPPSASCPGP